MKWLHRYSSFILHPSSFRNEAYGAFAYAYDQSLGQSFFAAVEPHLDRVLKRYPNVGSTHLDLACGTGLLIDYFSRRGFRSTGVDASVPMLSIASGRTDHLVCADFRQLPLRGRFAVVTAMYDSLNHLLSRRDLVCAFRSIRNVMHGQSLFIFDMNQPGIYLSAWATPEPFEARGSDFELRISTMYSRWRRLGVGRVSGWAEVDGRRIHINEVRRQRAYSRSAIERALSRAGLTVLEIRDFDPFPSSSTDHNEAKWLFVATA